MGLYVGTNQISPPFAVTLAGFARLAWEICEWTSSSFPCTSSSGRSELWRLKSAVSLNNATSAYGWLGHNKVYVEQSWRFSPHCLFSNGQHGGGKGEMNILHQTQMRPIKLPYPHPSFLLLLQLPSFPIPLLPAIQAFHSLNSTCPRQLAQRGTLLALQREFPEKKPLYLNLLDRDSQLSG